VAQLKDARLVLRAMGIAHAVVSESGEQLLVVPTADGLRAAQQLAAFAAENAGHDRAQPPRRASLGVPALLCWLAVLGGAHLAAPRWLPAGLGILDDAAVQRGRLELLATALTLHADAHHLAGNAVFGGLFVLLLAQLLGNGVALLAVLLAGVAGNGLNVLLRAEDHRALGASTAVFAALGLLVALGSRWRALQGTRRMRRWAPLVAGLGLLGWLGTSGEHTDIPAHAYGLLCGVVLGLGLGPVLTRGAARPTRQVAAGVCAAALLLAAWWRALS